MSNLIIIQVAITGALTAAAAMAAALAAIAALGKATSNMVLIGADALFVLVFPVGLYGPCDMA